MTSTDDYSIGVIPYRIVDGQRQFLLVRHNAGHWSFPKGHPEKSETPIQTALRELREETGITKLALTESPAFEEQYNFTKRSGRTVRKCVTYYVGLVADDAPPVRIQPTELRDFAWTSARGAAERLTFEEGRLLLTDVLAFLDAPRVL